jgi:hypothetical protein
MNRVLAAFPPAPFAERPDEVLEWIDPWTGLLARPDCPAPLRVLMAKGTGPRTACTRDHAADWEAAFARAYADSLEKAAADSSAAADSAAAMRDGIES